MSKVVAVIYISMDGVVEEPAWTGPYWNDEHAKFQQGRLFASRALLLGGRPTTACRRPGRRWRASRGRTA
ncbi:MAG TPA: hypothetical protein VGP70_03340 [Actinomadura sp.]|nr:hypothetical protein [Actinomadura sp.]